MDHSHLFQSRWESGEWLAALNALREHSLSQFRLIDTKFIRSLDLPSIDGRLDFRGIPWHVIETTPTLFQVKSGLRVKKQIFESIDFSYSNFYHCYLHESKIIDCIFDHAYLENFELNNVHVENSNFNCSELPWLGLSGSKIINCNFNRSKIRHFASIYGFSTIDDCSFENIDWRALEFGTCNFKNSKFSGTLKNSGIVGSCDYRVSARIRELFFKLAHGGLVVFEGCDFSRLQVSKLTIRPVSFKIKDCLGFPYLYLPNLEFTDAKDFYSKKYYPAR